MIYFSIHCEVGMGWVDKVCSLCTDGKMLMIVNDPPPRNNRMQHFILHVSFVLCRTPVLFSYHPAHFRSQISDTVIMGSMYVKLQIILVQLDGQQDSVFWVRTSHTISTFQICLFENSAGNCKYYSSNHRLVCIQFDISLMLIPETDHRHTI